MRIVDAYLNPILERALAKAKEEKEAGNDSEIKAGDVGEDDTLLDHLVRLTTGRWATHVSRCEVVLMFVGRSRRTPR